ncbi:MAG: AbrB/MazE/SpoVT family DNA-binding domain-containing protein [Pirellulaceae bacterium]
MQHGTVNEYWNCRLDMSGRIVLPQQIRSHYGLDNGDELVATMESRAIVLRTYSEAMQRLQDAFCDGLPEDVSLVDELIEQRKQEAAIEERR